MAKPTLKTQRSAIFNLIKGYFVKPKPTENPPIKTPWRKIFKLIKAYFFHSDEKLIAWLQLIGVIVCIAGFVGLMATLAWWFSGFYAVLALKALTPFLISMGKFAIILVGLVGTSVMKSYLMGKLANRWRKWQSKEMIKKLVFNRSLDKSKNNYLELSRLSKIKNHGQRIEQDVKTFVDLSLRLMSDFIESILSLAAFSGTLWIVGGALTFALAGLSIVIPGYLVWVALILAVGATIATHFIGKSLKKKTQELERANAELRDETTKLMDKAENTAAEKADNYRKNILLRKNEGVYKAENAKLKTQTKLTAFQSFYFQLFEVLPFICAAPLYFTGLIQLAQLMQIGFCFGRVGMAFSLGVNAYDSGATLAAAIGRIIEQEEAHDGSLSANPRNIIRKEKEQDTIKIRHLNVMKPDVSSTQCIISNLNLKLNKGENTLIQGPSGLGKSTLFKAIAGSWEYGDGKITVPKGKKMYFLPQEPTLDPISFMAVLAYPDPVNTYSKKQYIDALRAVGGMEQFIPKLRKKREWAKELSGGEKQRVCIARALLNQPDWLFLDESTAGLNKEKNLIYAALGQLPNTTLVGISHNDIDEKYYTRVVQLDVKSQDDKEAIVTEKKVRQMRLG